MNEHIILRVTVALLMPFIFMYGLYIQFHGEYSPGGGFQAGVICAAAFISYALVYGVKAVQKIIPNVAILWVSACGVLIYALTGVASMALGGEFLNYSVLSSDPVSGQKMGIIVIELGVGLTVFAVAMTIFYVFSDYNEEKE